MEGFQFSIRYTPERNRWRTLLTPVVLMLCIVLLSSFGFKQNINLHTPHSEHHSHVPPASSNGVQDDVAIQVRQSLHQQLFLQHPDQHYAALHASTPLIDRLLGALHHASIPTILIILSSLVLTAITLMAIGMTGHITLFLPVMLTLLFRKKYPTWWYQWNLQASRFSARIMAYAFFVVPNIPTLEACDHIILDIPNPQNQDLNRFLPLFKWLLALPHYVILLLLFVLALLLNLVVYPYVLVTAHYPKSLFDFMEGLMRWMLRVNCYDTLLCTDTYPKFSFKP